MEREAKAISSLNHPNICHLYDIGSQDGTDYFVMECPTNSLDARQLTDTNGAIFPFWSFDGRSVAFFADGTLKVVEISGGSPQVIADSGFGRGGAWGADGVIVFSPSTQDPLYRTSVNSGTVTPITTLQSPQQTSHRWPFFLPDGKHFLYLAINHDPSKSANDTVY